jgi:hypothetical protein
MHIVDLYKQLLRVLRKRNCIRLIEKLYEIEGLETFCARNPSTCHVYSVDNGAKLAGELLVLQL